MDAIGRTLATYENHVDHFVEKFLAEPMADRFGTEFRAALPGARILDVGCGPAPDVASFVETGYDVTGVDPAPSFLQVARTRVPAASFIRGDMRRLPFHDGVFHGLWCVASFLHVPREDAPETLTEFRRVLTPDGVLFLTLLHGEESGYNSEGRYFERYRTDEIRSLLAETGFDPRSVEHDDEWLQALAIRG